MNRRETRLRVVLGSLLAVSIGLVGAACGSEGRSTDETPVGDAGRTAETDGLPSKEVCRAVCTHVYETCDYEFPRDQRMPINREACYKDCLYGWFDGAENCLREAECSKRTVLQCVRDVSPGKEIGDPCDEGTQWPDQWAQFEERVLELTNERRAGGATCAGEEFEPAPPLEMNARLRCAARRHSRDMADREYFAHESPDGSTPSQRVDEAGYEFRAVGENIARGSTTPEQVVEGWMNSPGHCKNIMRQRYQDLGIGYVGGIGTSFEDIWTQAFGTPR